MCVHSHNLMQSNYKEFVLASSVEMNIAEEQGYTGDQLKRSNRSRS